MARMMITKKDRARVIVAALYDLPTIADVDDPRVIRLARRPAAHLESQFVLALEIINERKAAE